MVTHLSNELSYLRNPAMTYGPAWRYWAADNRVERHGEAWRCLAEVHDSIIRQEDQQVIVDWLGQPGQSSVHRDEQGQVRRLLRLLRQLGMAGVKPFNNPVLPIGVSLASSRKARGEQAESCARLPSELRYIVGRIQSLRIRPRWQAVSDYVDNINEDQFNALVVLADNVRRTGNDRQLRRWLEASRRVRSRDVALVRSFFHVLDALEIF